MPDDPTTPAPDPPPGGPWVLVLVPEGESPVPVGRRVARLLKYAGRVCGLRCLSVQADVPTVIEVKAKRKVRTPTRSINGKEGEVRP